MAKEFIQVSATKSNGDFMFCSNLSLMNNGGVTPADAFVKLVKLAQEYAGDGYDIKWTREPLSEFDLQFYGELFDGQ